MGDQTSWHRRAAAVVVRHIYLKGIGTMIFIAVFFGAYFYLLKAPAFPTTVMPITFLDQLIGFQPLALPLYVSLWVYVSLPPALLATRRELYFYGTALAVPCLIGLTVFYFWPTAVPAANIDWARYPEMSFLKDMDASGNACPSLHVTTAVFSGVWLHHLLRRLEAPRSILVFNLLWGAGIVYSTVATRQHVVVDVLAGIVLGALAACTALRFHVDTGEVEKIRHSCEWP
ncbi:MAG: phosphatase PAP2 family protein [Arenicellales bacterium]